MGYYIECVENNPHGSFQKALYAQTNYGAEYISRAEAEAILDDGTSTDGVIVVVNNGYFEACAFAYNRGEFDHFMWGIDTGQDNRPMEIMKINRELAVKLSGYNR